ncbi:zinc finger protein 112-like [Amphibalanus amphitrite]|uniref:zinc finger protein 112-like n=1 Tax=Amphibalanus amphitrite TaxID=1232801 RepID=UPI001C914C93|nr:zinc finger protein 112-like [Amphibalanus amphitrite]
MRKLLAQLLGNNFTKWQRLKIATGVVSDEDLLINLIDFYAESKGIRLTEPAFPPLAPVNTQLVNVQLRPKKKDDTSSYIVIHQEEIQTEGENQMDNIYVVEESAEQQTSGQTCYPMMMLREDEEEAEEDDGEKYDPTADDYKPEFFDRPVDESKGVFFREPVRPRMRFRCPFSADGDSRVVDGMLWREAVLRLQTMPLEGVRLVNFCDRPESIAPAPLPWDEVSPIPDVPSEAPLLKECGCALCDKIGFSSRTEVAAHFWLEHPDTRQRSPTACITTKREPDFAHCSLCQSVGSVNENAKRNKLTLHVARAHATCREGSERAPHVCDVCGAELPSVLELECHVTEKHPGSIMPSFECPVCELDVRGQQVYIRHLMIHYTEYVYACNVCPNFRTRDAQSMAEHTERHDRRTFRCGQCELRTSTFRTLVDHVRGHLKLPSHVCSICGYKAYTSSRYHNHMDSHGGRRHRCELCGLEFKSLLKKSQHKIVVHRRPAKFTCERCDVTFKSSSRLRRHQASHTGYKPFKCVMCGKGLSSKQSLRNHSKICPEGEVYPAVAGGVVQWGDMLV